MKQIGERNEIGIDPVQIDGLYIQLKYICNIDSLDKLICNTIPFDYLGTNHLKVPKNLLSLFLYIYINLWIGDSSGWHRLAEMIGRDRCEPGTE